MDPPARCSDPTYLSSAICLLLAALASAHMTGAAIAEGQFSYIGLGDSSCGTWTAARRRGIAFGYEQWIVGFLSGFADASVSSGGRLDLLQRTDANGVWAWIDTYCQSHPIELIVRAGEAFVIAYPN